VRRHWDFHLLLSSNPFAIGAYHLGEIHFPFSRDRRIQATDSLLGLSSALTNLESPLLSGISFAKNFVQHLPVAGFLDCVSVDPAPPPTENSSTLFFAALRSRT
jgi:hypothetical protein